MTDVTPIRTGIVAGTDERREMEQVALEAIRVAAENGRLVGMAIVAFSSGDDTAHAIRRVYQTGVGPTCSFVEAKAAAVLLNSSLNGAA